MKHMQGYAWPGSIRELQNVIEYVLTMGEGPIIEAKDLPPEVRGIVPAFLQTSNTSYHALRGALEEHGWHREKTALSLGISRATLWRRMREAGLHKPGA